MGCKRPAAAHTRKSQIRHGQQNEGRNNPMPHLSAAELANAEMAMNLAGVAT